MSVLRRGNLFVDKQTKRHLTTADPQVQLSPVNELDSRQFIDRTHRLPSNSQLPFDLHSDFSHTILQVCSESKPALSRPTFLGWIETLMTKLDRIQNPSCKLEILEITLHS